MLEDIAEARLRCSSISLEDGADEAWLNGEAIGFCEGGMCFPSRWQFEPGTTLAAQPTGSGDNTQDIVAMAKDTQMVVKQISIHIVSVHVNTPFSK